MLLGRNWLYLFIFCFLYRPTVQCAIGGKKTFFLPVCLRLLALFPSQRSLPSRLILRGGREASRCRSVRTVVHSAARSPDPVPFSPPPISPPRLLQRLPPGNERTKDQARGEKDIAQGQQQKCMHTGKVGAKIDEMSGWKSATGKRKWESDSLV